MKADDRSDEDHREAEHDDGFPAKGGIWSGDCAEARAQRAYTLSPTLSSCVYNRIIVLLLPPAPAARVEVGRSLSADLDGRLAALRLLDERLQWCSMGSAVGTSTYRTV